MRRLPLILTIVMFTLAGHGARAAAGETRLLRFPDIHGDTVVFCYAGDLWKAPVSGGTAVRLTVHPGQELFPRFSPDGRMIAFTGQYDGDEQVYVMPAEGGVPRRLTWYPARGPTASASSSSHSTARCAWRARWWTGAATAAATSPR